MARGRHYAKLSLSNAARLSFSDLCILLFMFLSLFRLCVCVFLCSHWSLVDVPLIFFCPADHVPDWQPRVLLGMVEARSVNVKKTTTTTTIGELFFVFAAMFPSRFGYVRFFLHNIKEKQYLVVSIYPILFIVQVLPGSPKIVFLLHLVFTPFLTTTLFLYR